MKSSDDTLVIRSVMPQVDGAGALRKLPHLRALCTDVTSSKEVRPMSQREKPGDASGLVRSMGYAELNW